MTASPPPAPSLEHLRTQAEDLLRGARAGDPDALARVAAVAPRPGEPLRLSGAQLAIAREHGFPSWPRLAAYVRRVAAHGPGLQHAFREDAGYYDERAGGLLASAQEGTASATALFARRQAPLTRAGAREVVAREHGFPSWRALRRHVGRLRESGEPFARAYRAVEARDAGALRALLDRFPFLVAAQGTNGNDLLGLATGTCDRRLVDLLLERGADVASANAHGWTPLHQAAYMGRPALARRLLDAGAPVDVSGRGDGGTPLVVALFWGHRETAELLASVRAVPGNLRVAAGLGDVARIEALTSPVGAEAGAHRAFYRPHGGFPAWRPADDPQEVLDEALAWAARNDRPASIEALVRAGARVDADVYRGTPLAWAAATGRADAIRTLLGLGADVNGRGGFGGPDHGEGVTPLHLAAQGGRLAAIRALVDGGADASLRDRLYGGTPADWAEHGGQAAAAKLLRRA